MITGFIWIVKQFRHVHPKNWNRCCVLCVTGFIIISSKAIIGRPAMQRDKNERNQQENHMQIHVAQIQEQGLALEIDKPATVFPELKQMETRGDCQFLTHICAHLGIRKIMDVIEVTGNLETKMRISCSRCLAEYNEPLVRSFTVSFTRDITDPREEAEIALTAEDLGLIYYEGDTIDLRDAIQEQVILSLPVRPLCRENCKGLCQQCGENRNDTDCGCQGNGAIDPRFVALKKLKLPDK